MKTNKYTLYWLTGKREVVEGTDPANAMTLAGYGGGAVRALDFYANGDNNEYEWHAATRSWEKKAPIVASKYGDTVPDEVN